MAGWDALGRPTTYAQSFDATGNRVKTTTYADGSTRLEVYGQDGSLRSVSGTAAQPSRYEIGIEQDGNVWREYTREIKLNEQLQDTQEWTKTYKDGQGRTHKTVYPDGSSRQIVYNAAGQRTMEIDPDGVTTLFAYNAMGELEYHALDVNRNGQINLNGQDRVSRTVREYAQRDGFTVERVSTYEWPRLNDDHPDLVSTRETTLNGQRFTMTWASSHGLTNSTYIDWPANGQKRIISSAPDGSQSVNL